MFLKQYLPLIIVAVVFAGAGFFGGMKYQQNQIRTNAQNIRQFGNGFNGSANNRNQNGQRAINGNSGMRPVAGKIISADDKSITVQMQDGSSRIIFLSQNTQINKAEAASASDLKTGETVAVFGTQNSDGSVTAQNIQLNPEQRNLPR